MAVKKKKPKYKYVEVTWVDAVSVSEWVTEDNLPELATIITRGWLIYEDTTRLTIAGTLAKDGGYGEVISIPRCWANVKPLKVSNG